MHWSLIVSACVIAMSCGTSEKRVSLADFKAKNAAKIEALKTNLTRAANTVLAAPPAPDSSCDALDLRLNGKNVVGTTEVLWADQVAGAAAGQPTDASKDPHLVATVDVAGWCQLIEHSMYWLRSDVTTDLNKDGLGPKVAGWIESALDLKYVVLLEPGASARGTQQIELSVVELATGAVRCAHTLTGEADPSLGVEHYDLIRKSTGERVGKTQLDKYSQAMKADLQAKLATALRKALSVETKGYCAHP